MGSGRYIYMSRYINAKNYYDEPKGEYNIVSCSVFRMKEGYKKEKVYKKRWFCCKVRFCLGRRVSKTIR